MGGAGEGSRDARAVRARRLPARDPLPARHGRRAPAARLPHQGRGPAQGARSRQPSGAAMSDIEGLDRVTYGVEDLEACKRFFLDWGLKLVREGADGLDFESLNGCELWVRKTDDPSLPPAVEAGPTVREVIWGVRTAADLEALERRGPLPAIDPNGIGIGFRITRK